MRLIDHVTGVFDDAAAKKWQSALMHACISVDATARVLYPSEMSNAQRFKRCIRAYLWLIEPMIGVGFNLVDTRFTNVKLGKNASPDFADLAYDFRCSHTHGDEVPPEFSMMETEGGFLSNWAIGPNSVRMPDRVIWALTSVAVFSHANYRHRGKGGTCRLSWGDEIYPIAEWWGRESEIKVIAQGWNTQRVELKELYRLNQADPLTGSSANLVLIAPPPT